MDVALVLSGILLGLAGAPHCAAMCAAPCALAVGQGGPASLWTFHLSRISGYALAGSLVAASVGSLATLASFSPALRPMWTLIHVAALALGIWLAWHGRQPAWVENFGRYSRQPVQSRDGWVSMRGPVRAGVLGAAWVAWPCGLLQSALVVAALANGAVGGALVMGAFGAATAGGLMIGPWVWRRVGGGAATVSVRSGIRLAGGVLAGASAWTLGHGLWQSGLAYCFG